MLSRCTFPAVLKRSSSVLACQAIRAASRPLQAIATKTSCSTLKQVRGQQTQAAPFPTTQVVRQVKTLEEERLVEIEWEDGGQSFYPFTWLRDNCQCPLCTLQSAQARSLLLSKLDIHTGVDSVQVSDTNKVGSCDLNCNIERFHTVCNVE